MATKYSNIKNYKNFFNIIINDKRSFKVVETSYTRKIILPEYTVIFNEDGCQDIRLLGLINKVRGDAKNSKIQTNNTYIDFFSLTNSIPEGLAAKIDINSAYWNIALKRGIISEETNKYFIEKYQGKPIKEAKKARLKALGSLATTKRILKYNKGILSSSEIKVEETKPIYMEICRMLDEVMKQASLIPGTFYYYWDCLFIDKLNEKEATNFFKNEGFGTTIDETYISYIEIGNVGYLLSKSDEKMYMVRNEEKFLLDKNFIL